MNLTQPTPGARSAAEEIIPLPVLSRLFGGRRQAREIEVRRRSAERIIDTYCVDRGVALKALHALTAETRRLAIGGRVVPPDLAEALTALERALGME
jgi:hypothetical protein